MTELYYSMLFIILLLVQKTAKGRWLTLIFLGLTILSSPIIDGYMEAGVGFYESAYLFEVFSFLILLIGYPKHSNNTALLLVAISFLYNLTYTMTDSIVLENLIYENYEVFNIILFECIVCLCFIETKVYRYLKDNFNGEERC